MTVAATAARVEATYEYLRRRADQKLPAPTNKEIAIRALKMGKQSFQPWDRTQGIKWSKCEHGAVAIAALEALGRIKVTRGRNWREIVIIETGQVLPPQRNLASPVNEAEFRSALERLRDEFDVDPPPLCGLKKQARKT